MSTQHEQSAVATEAAAPLEEQAVEAFLREQPDFFERHLDLLAAIRIPHPSGKAVSLIEHQVAVLRDQNRKYKHKLMDLVQVARDNDGLHRNLHRLALALLAAGSTEQVLDRTMEILAGDFKAELVGLRLRDLPPGVSVRGVRPLVADDPELAHFERFFKAGRPLCGTLHREQATYLFGDQAGELGSAAVVPLGTGGALGMLAIGNSDRQHFHPGMETMFLRHLGELVGCALETTRS